MNKSSSSFDGKRTEKTKQELNIERKLKFFICSVAFNGPDGCKLPNLNDINEDILIRTEEPCNLLDLKHRYPCEPTPLLVSSCLLRPLKRQTKAKSRPSRGRRSAGTTHRRNGASVRVTGPHASSASSVNGRLQHSMSKQDHNRILDEINRMFHTATNTTNNNNTDNNSNVNSNSNDNPAHKNISILKQLLLRSASEQHMAFTQSFEQNGAAACNNLRQNHATSVERLIKSSRNNDETTSSSTSSFINNTYNNNNNNNNNNDDIYNNNNTYNNNNNYNHNNNTYNNYNNNTFNNNNNNNTYNTNNNYNTYNTYNNNCNEQIDDSLNMVEVKIVGKDD